MTQAVWSLVWSSTLQTLIMVFFSTIFSLILGFPLGVLLCISRSELQGGLKPMPVLNTILDKLVNVLRSFPFIILMVVLFPLSRVLVGTTIGTKATIVPLSIAAAPFVARVIESSLKEVDSGVVQAARSMGSTNSQIIFKVLIPEALPSLVADVTLTIINLIGYSAMAGAIGGGGLGDLAIRYGYLRSRNDVLIVAVLVILVMVELIQFIGNKISAAIVAKR